MESVLESESLTMSVADHLRVQPIALGRGIDIAWPPFHLTWASFKDTSGGVLMFGLPVGLCAGVSLVTGGVLHPVPGPDILPKPPVPFQRKPATPSSDPPLPAPASTK